MPKRAPHRTAGRPRHPFLEGKDLKVWHPEAVGVVPNYAKTLEAFQKRQAHGSKVMAAIKASGRPFSRKGVPDGYARRRLGVESFKALAKHEAIRIMDYLRKEDMLVEPDNEFANTALLYGIELVRDNTAATQYRIAAMKTVLEYTQSKPSQKIDTTVRTAESWLDEVNRDALAKSR